MSEGRKPENFTCSLIYDSTDRNGKIASAGNSKAVIGTETLSLTIESGPVHTIALRDIERIVPGKYTIEILLGRGEKLSFSGLGYRYDDFLRILQQNRNELILADMLADEAVLIPDIDGEAEVCESTGRALLQGKCRVRLYRTSLAVLPLLGEIMRIPLGCLKEEIRVENYRLILETDTGEKLVFFKLGGRLDFLKKSLADALAELAVNAQNYLKELFPKVKPEALFAAASLLRDGKAAFRSSIEAVAPGLWQELETEFLASEIGESYRHLQALGKREKVAFGFKRGLMGSLGGDTLWFLIPVYSNDPQVPGNALAMEAGTIQTAVDIEEPSASREDPLVGGGGKATYFFRLISRGKYSETAGSGELDRNIDVWIRRFNRAMLAVNFRREPIYLSDEKLQQPEYRHYRFSLQRLPELQILRNHFIGRVIHRNQNQWRTDVAELLHFNARSKDDAARWEKGE